MTAANVYLLRQNRTLQATREGRAEEVPVGKVVADINGVDMADKPVSLTLSQRKATVLMIYSPTCPFCRRNWPTWTTLIDKQQNNPDVDIAVIDMTATATPEFITREHVGRAHIIHKLDPRDAIALNLNFVPQTIVIGSDSRVKGVWTGVLSQENIQQIARLLL